MITKIIGALLIIGFFFISSKVAISLVGENNPLSKAFPIGSGALVFIILWVMFF